ncbi:MAG: DNA-deoxyinosine glycosylase [Methylobacter sp.]|jgi:hypoxanthine-DNA glycosylase
MSDITGFAPIVSGNAKVLILGSMPSVASLSKQQYYGHPKNAFWPIMGALFGADPVLCYQLRKEILMANGIAVWDVLQGCKRVGSSDSNIKLASIKINDFGDFFAKYEFIERVFFNGATAEKLYKKHVRPTLNQRFSYLEYQRLPSTSPAHASLKLEEKIEAWKVVKLYVVK